MTEQQPTNKCQHCGYPVEIGEHAPDCPNKTADSEKSDDGVAETKSPQDIKDQFRHVDMYRENIDYESESLPFPDDEIFRLTKAELEVKLENNPALKEQYLEYIKSLRDLRKEMAKRRKQEKSEDDDQVPLHEQTPEFLLEKTLGRLKGSRSTLSEKFISDSEAEEAAKSNEAFISLIEKTMYERPDFFLRQSEQIRGLFSKETLKKVALFSAERSPTNFIEALPKIHNLFTDDELDRVVTKATAVESGYATNYLLDSPEIRNRLPKDYLRTVAKKLNEENLLDNVNELIAEDLLDSADAKDTFRVYLTKERVVLGAYKNEAHVQYLALFKEQSEKDELISILDEKLDKGDFSNFHASLDESIENYAQMAGEDWKKKAIGKMIEKKFARIVTYPELVISQIGEDGYKKFVDEIIEVSSDRDQHEIDYILTSDKVSEEQRKKMMSRLPDISPYLVFYHRHRAMQEMTESEKSDFMKKVMNDYPQSIEHPAGCMKYITDMTNEEKKLFVQDLIKQSDGMDVLRTYNGSANNEDTKMLKEAISRDEMEKLVMEKALLDPFKAFLSLDQISRFLGSEQELKKFILAFSKESPNHALSNFKVFADLFDSEERLEVLKEFIRQSPVGAIDAIENWSNFVDYDFAKSFVSQSIKEHPDVSLELISRMIRFVDENERVNVINDLIAKNPFLAMADFDRLKRHTPNLTEENIIDNAMQDDEMTRVAPKTTISYLKRFKQVKTLDQKVAIARQGFRVYRSINKIRNAGVEEGMAEIIRAENLSEKNELKILESYYGYAILKENGFIDASDIPPQTSQELEKILSEKVAEVLESEDLTSEEKALAIEKFGGAAPILLYASKHKGSERIMLLLKEIYKQAGKGNYDSWRFETDRPVEELKAEGKLPENLTPGQYEDWMQEESSDSLETLTTSAKDISKTVKSIIFTNLNELGMEGLVDSDPQEEIDTIKGELVQIGQELGRLGKQLAVAEESKKPEIEEQIRELKDARDERVKYRNFLRLMTLRGKEIVQGYLLEGEGEKKSQKLSKFLNQLKNEFPEVSEIVAKVQEAISELGSGDQSAQVLEASDTSNLETCFKIGSEPVQSCQDYASGGQNEALLGYVAEANTKVEIIKNEKGNILARRIVRLIELPNGDPAIFIEQKYSSTSSGVVDRVMINHIMKKARKMGVKVYVKGEDEAPAGFDYNKSKDTLESKGGRAPFVYVDAAGGEKSLGKYKVNGISEVKESKTE